MEFIELVKVKQRMCMTIACCDCLLSMQNNDAILAEKIIGLRR